MNPIASQESFAPFSHGEVAGGRSYQAEQTNAGSMSLEQSMDLTIITEEGDTVTLSLASSTQTHAGIYRSDSYQDDWAASSQTAFFEFSRSQNMAIEVNGDLNEEELEDIREAMKAIGAMIDDFLSGDLQEMARDGQLLKELDSVSSLEAAFSYERQVLYGEQEKVQINSVAPEKSGNVHRRGHDRLQGLMNRIDRLSDDVIDQVKEFHGPRKRLSRSVKEFLGKYLSGEAVRAPKDELGREVIQTLRSAFVQKIQTLTETASINLSYTA